MRTGGFRRGREQLLMGIGGGGGGGGGGGMTRTTKGLNKVNTYANSKLCEYIKILKHSHVTAL